MPLMTRQIPAIAVLSLLLASCVSAPPPPPPPPVDTTTPAQRIAVIDASGGVDDTEVNVQPLRDPAVQDLRDSAKRKRAAGDLAGAAAALDQALKLVSDDPALLQDRAEVALLQKDNAQAEAFAKRAIDLGSQTGPLCRRHWATVEQARLALGQKESAASAHTQIAGCTVPGIKRY
ncbi:hypothetical protein [Xanthomonas albilineans]|uniref:hypothetical protein n=1 Tax=Xanthomonas albilineans TaxID=29447 RepID=UPI0005F30B1A|nr:hypothetical protein [Xanthomonas albilineans]